MIDMRRPSGGSMYGGEKLVRTAFSLSLPGGLSLAVLPLAPTRS
jgi:hypothetical protein